MKKFYCIDSRYDSPEAEPIFELPDVDMDQSDSIQEVDQTDSIQEVDQSDSIQEVSSSPGHSNPNDLDLTAPDTHQVSML